MSTRIAILAIAEQICGHINVINFGKLSIRRMMIIKIDLSPQLFLILLTIAPVIFAEVFYNEDENEASLNGDEIALVFLGIVKLLITIFVLFSVDALGRLFFLKAGATIVTVSLLFVAISLSVSWETTMMTQSGEMEIVHSKVQDVLVLIGCTGVVTGFALSYGPIVWLIASELSPSSIRGRMLGFFTVLTHGCAAIVTFTFLSGQEKYGDAYPFWIYFVCSLSSLAFIFVAVPETEGIDACECDDVKNLLDETPFWSKNSLIAQWYAACLERCIRKPPVQGIQRQDSRIDLCFDDEVDPSQRFTYT